MANVHFLQDLNFFKIFPDRRGSDANPRLTISIFLHQRNDKGAGGK